MSLYEKLALFGLVVMLVVFFGTPLPPMRGGGCQ